MSPLPKVLLVHSYYRASMPSGEGVVFEAERDLLAARGHEVVEYTRHAEEIGDGAAAQLKAGLSSVWSRDARRDIARLIARERPEVAHFHNTFPLISPSSYAACRDAGVPVVQALHNFRPACLGTSLYREGAPCHDCLGRGPARGIARGCYRDSRAASAVAAASLLSQRTLGDRLVDLYVTPTRFTRDMLVRGGLDAGRIVVKPHFVDPDPGTGAGPRDGAVFVGRLSAEKGLPTVLRAWCRLPRAVPLTIVGDGPLAGDVAELRRRVPEVRWERALTLDGVLGVLRRAKMLLFPSASYETFGRVVIEAFATGTPVVTTGMGGTRELVTAGRTGLLVPPGDDAALAGAVRLLDEEHGTARRMGAEARAAFEHAFTAGSNYDRLMAIYARVLRLPIPVPAAGPVRARPARGRRRVRDATGS